MRYGVGSCPLSKEKVIIVGGIFTRGWWLVEARARE
jgi:hypothetical protein